eukprot:jgi/Botrbrau1/624/Bobra.0161s0015.1
MTDMSWSVKPGQSNFLQTLRTCHNFRPSRIKFVAYAGKGFGKVERTDSLGKKNAEKAKNPKRAVAAPQTPVEENFRLEEELPTVDLPQDNEKEFQRRLAALKRQGEARLKEQAKAVEERPSILDATPDIYSNPPPLSQTLFPQPAKSEKEARLGEENTDRSQATTLAAAVGVFALVAVFLFIEFSGGGGAPSPSQQLASEERKELEGELEKFRETLKADPANVEALQAAAGTVVALSGDFKAAAGFIEKWAEAEPTNVDAWQALAEVRGKAKDFRGAVEAYERAQAELPEESIFLLQGLSNIILAEGDAPQAVALVQAASERASKGAPGSLDYYEAQLLLAQVYSQWSRHFVEAQAVYDGLIEKYPDDYRAFLAKGVLLKGNGRAGDAQRMFLQARFLAPPGARSAVDQVISR